MSKTPNTAVAVIGIDIGKNSFHVVGHDARGAIVLWQKRSSMCTGRQTRGSADQKNQLAAKVAGFAYPVRGHGFAKPIACHFRRTDGP
jgi:hypothetical protein